MLSADWKHRLHPDLQPYMRGNDLAHPLLWRVEVTADQIDEINETFLHRKQEADESRRSGDWDGFFAIVERPSRFEVLAELLDELSEEKYAALFAQIWVESEEIWRNMEIVERLLAKRRPAQEYMMNEEEKRLLQSLPDSVDVFRGYSHDNMDGLSWTISEERAIWFAKKDADDSHAPEIVRGKSQKADLIALFNRRNEHEVIVEPSKVQEKSTRRVR